MDESERFAVLERALHHVGQVQVDSDSVNQARGNAIVVAEGLLAVAAQAIAKDTDRAVPLLLLALFGALLSLSWLLFEQRNQVYFTSRGEVLEQLEDQVVRAAAAHGVDYPRFWTSVPKVANQQARWYQRHSAPRVIRTYLPSLFSIGWVVVAVGALVSR